MPEIGDRPVYITIDIDVLDPAFAPGTGTLESGGITSKEMLEAIHEITFAGTKVIGADIVEVAPIYDVSDQTAILASKLIREMLLGFIYRSIKMSDKIDITITTKIKYTDNTEENFKNLYEGVIYNKSNEYYIRYQETIEQNLGNTWAIIKWKKIRPK